MHRERIDGPRPAPRHPFARAPGTPRDHLRAATRQAHDRVDAAFGGFDLGHRESYGLFLLAHQAVLPGCEAVLTEARAETLLPDWQERRRSAALAEDLEALGLTSRGAWPVPAVRSAAEAMGMLYVLEGSRLGGAVLARRVAEGADPHCRTATRYLRHGEGRRLWPTFVAAFDASARVREELPTVTHAALRTFDLFTAAARAVAPRSFPGATS